MVPAGISGRSERTVERRARTWDVVDGGANCRSRIAYWELLQSGVGTVAACRELGVTRWTAHQWRAERGGWPPLRLAEAARGARYLSSLEGAADLPH